MILLPRPGLDNSHDVSVESVTRKSRQCSQRNSSASLARPAPTRDTSAFSRFFRSSVTERRKTANDNASLHLLQLQFDNDEAMLATNTAEMTARNGELTATATESEARTAAARRTTKLMDLESRELDGRSSQAPSSSPKLSTHSDASPRHVRTPPPLPGGMNDINAVLLHLESRR